MKSVFLVYRNEYDHQIIDSVYSTYQFAVERIKQLYKILKQTYIDDSQQVNGYSIEVLEEDVISISFCKQIVASCRIKQFNVVK